MTVGNSRLLCLSLFTIIPDAEVHVCITLASFRVRPCCWTPSPGRMFISLIAIVTQPAKVDAGLSTCVKRSWPAGRSNRSRKRGCNEAGGVSNWPDRYRSSRHVTTMSQFNVPLPNRDPWPSRRGLFSSKTVFFWTRLLLYPSCGQFLLASLDNGTHADACRIVWHRVLQVRRC